MSEKIDVIAGRTDAGPDPDGAGEASWFLIATLTAAGVGAGLVVAREVLAWVLAPLIMWALVYLLANTLLPDRIELRRSAIRWAAIVFGVHLLVGIGIWFVPGARAYFGPDSALYHTAAAALAESWSSGAASGGFVRLAGTKEGFVYTLAGTYWFFGSFAIAGLTLNAALASAVVPLMVDATDRLFDSRAAKFVGPIVAFVPSFIVFQSQLLREAGVIFLLAAALNAGIRLASRMQLMSVLVAAGATAMLFTYRGFVAPLAMGGIVAGVVMSRHDKVRGLATGATIASLMVFVVFGLGLGYSGYRSVSEVDLRYAQVARLDLATSGSSGFDAGVDISTGRGVVSYLPVAQARFWLGPFPWEILAPRHAPAAADILVWWYFLPSLVTGVGIAVRRRYSRALIVALPALAVAGAVSLVIGNFGTLVRERAQVILILVPLIALGMSMRRTPEHQSEATSSS